MLDPPKHLFFTEDLEKSKFNPGTGGHGKHANIQT
jgi:hypothetical protein